MNQAVAQFRLARMMPLYKSARELCDRALLSRAPLRMDGRDSSTTLPDWAGFDRNVTLALLDDEPDLKQLCETFAKACETLDMEWRFVRSQRPEQSLDEASVVTREVASCVEAVQRVQRLYGQLTKRIESYLSDGEAKGMTWSKSEAGPIIRPA